MKCCDNNNRNQDLIPDPRRSLLWRHLLILLGPNLSPLPPSLDSPGTFLDFRSPAGPACCSQTDSVCTSDGNLERIEEFGWRTGLETAQAGEESLKYRMIEISSGGHLGNLSLKVRTDNRMNS